MLDYFRFSPFIDNSGRAGFEKKKWKAPILCKFEEEESPDAGRMEMK